MRKCSYAHNSYAMTIMNKWKPWFQKSQNIFVAIILWCCYINFRIDKTLGEKFMPLSEHLFLSIHLKGNMRNIFDDDDLSILRHWMM